jgi:NAD(P)-dependent dehydrogenase (short-subunit alcohol dehydrogenase family)
MKTFSGKVSVITGAASGIGRAVAKQCAKIGMRVVLADIEGSALLQTENELRAGGANVLAVLTDVSRAGDMEMLAKKTLDAFGEVHLLFNIHLEEQYGGLAVGDGRKFVRRDSWNSRLYPNHAGTG